MGKLGLGHYSRQLVILDVSIDHALKRKEKKLIKELNQNEINKEN